MTKVYLTEQAQKDLKRITNIDQEKIRKKLLSLTIEPKLGKKLEGKLHNFYSLRVWPYRIIYFIDSSEVWIVHIKHRKEVYKKIR